MKLIVCLDDRNGMAFHNRRQSSDLTVTKKIVELVRGHKLWMSSYSGYLFADFPENIQIDDDFLSNAPNDDFCFAEVSDIRSAISKVQELYVFRWNRTYPCDLFFPNIPGKSQFLAEFTGNSHEKITLEVYRL